MELYDSFGQRTQLKFSELEYNPELDSEHFVFKTPEGEVCVFTVTCVFELLGFSLCVYLNLFVYASKS